MFDLDLALNTFLPMAEAAYCRGSLPAGFSPLAELKLDASIAVAHFNGMHEDPLNTAFGFVAESQDSVVVSFRGTQTECEWGDDFDFVWDRFIPVLPSIQIEQGFKTVYMALRDSLDWPANPKRLLITGHSLGAALALLCGVDLQDRGMHPELYTFAGPRVGGRMFRDYFDRHVPECYRIVNQWDLVPHAPLEIMGYVHVGTEVRIDGGFTADPHVAHSLTSYRTGLEAKEAKKAA